MDTDRNLLFAVLALQAGLLDRDRFTQACLVWTGCKDRRLADLLVEMGWLDPADRTAIDQLLARPLARDGGDARASLAALAGPAVWESLAAVPDEDIRASVANWPAYVPPAPVSSSAVASRRGERYSRLRLHATGGLGWVWLARDQVIGRDVAVKELHGDPASRPALRARFVEEARITGQLEHPNIVPVYELSDPPDGEPSYAMRFVRGRTLAEAVREFHAGPGLAADRLGLRRLLGAFVAVCQKVGYAHSRGVIHRDLKPHNVVLGDFGEVILLDWGLAKVLGAADRPDTDGAPVTVPSRIDEYRTAAGHVLGTPAYMAPEQAEGRPDAIDARTDVYGLGAVLYEILAGRPPYADRSSDEVLRLVRQQDPIPPRRRRPGVPAALDAVCRTALARDPAGRYASATELGDEVQRWLADEPVRAYRDAWPARAGRWARRHRTGVAACAAGLIIAVLSLAGASGLLAEANGRERSAREAAENAAAEARRARVRTREALDALTSQVVEDLMGRRARPTAEQRQFLDRALASYEEFIADGGEDLDDQADRAAAYRWVGVIRDRLGQPADARAAFRRSLDLYALLAADHPDRLDLAAGRAEALTELGFLTAHDGDPVAAEQLLREAVAVRRRAVTTPQAGARERAGLAAALNNLARVEHDRGRSASAAALFDEGLALLGGGIHERSRLPPHAKPGHGPNQLRVPVRSAGARGRSRTSLSGVCRDPPPTGVPARPRAR